MATSQQQALAMLSNANSIRLWLSRGRPQARRRSEEYRTVANMYLQRRSPESAAHKEPKFGFLEWTRLLSAQMHETGAQRPRTPGEWLALMRDSAHELRQQHDAEFRIGWREQDKYKDIEYRIFQGVAPGKFHLRPDSCGSTEASFGFSGSLFPSGIWVVPAFQWVEEMGGQALANRNILTFFMTSVGVFLVICLSVASNMIDNQDKKAKEFDLAHLGGPHKPAALAQLEKELEDIWRRLQSLAEQQMNLTVQGADLENQIRNAERTTQETSAVKSSDAPETG